MREEKIGLSFCLLLSNQNFKQKINGLRLMGVMLRVAMVTDSNVS